MTTTPDHDPERPTARALVAQSIGLALRDDDDGVNTILDGLSLEELRFYAGAALELATALAVESFGSEDAAARYAEVVWLNATAESTTEEE